eukprot:828062_1
MSTEEIAKLEQTWVQMGYPDRLIQKKLLELKQKSKQKPNNVLNESQSTRHTQPTTTCTTDKIEQPIGYCKSETITPHTDILKNALQNEAFVDTELRIGTSKYRINRFLFAVVSNRFAQILYPKNNPIKSIQPCADIKTFDLDDIDDKYFSCICEYAYYGTVHLDINDTNILYIIDTAHKYRITELEKHCVHLLLDKYINKPHGIRYLLHFLNYANTMKTNHQTQNILFHLQQKPLSDVIINTAFIDLTSKAMHALFSNVITKQIDQLNGELLWIQILKWAERQSQRNIQIKKRLLSNIKQYFLSIFETKMSSGFIEQYVLNQEIFTRDEIAVIKSQFAVSKIDLDLENALFYSHARDQTQRPILSILCGYLDCICDYFSLIIALKYHMTGSKIDDADTDMDVCTDVDVWHAIINREFNRMTKHLDKNTLNVVDEETENSESSHFVNQKYLNDTVAISSVMPSNVWSTQFYISSVVVNREKVRGFDLNTVSKVFYNIHSNGYRGTSYRISQRSIEYSRLNDIGNATKSNNGGYDTHKYGTKCFYYVYCNVLDESDAIAALWTKDAIGCNVPVYACSRSAQNKAKYELQHGRKSVRAYSKTLSDDINKVAKHFAVHFLPMICCQSVLILTGYEYISDTASYDTSCTEYEGFDFWLQVTDHCSLVVHFYKQRDC